MASKGRWVFGVRRTPNGTISVVVGDDKDTGPTTEVLLSSMPRHELMRVCGHLGLKSSLNDSVEALGDRIVAYCNDDANLDEHLYVRPTFGRGVPKAKTESPTEPKAPKVVPSRPTEPKAPKGGIEGAIGDIVTDIVNDIVEKRLADLKVGVDMDQVEDLVKRAVADVVSRPTQIVLKDKPTVTITGRTHKQFEELLVRVSARRHQFITGEAGIGKTFTAEQVGEALGLPVTTMSADPLPQKTEVFGGVSPVTGQVIKGAVRDRYEHGGIFVLDEWDTGHSSLGTTLNKLLSSSSFDFPTEGGGTVNVRKHPDFVVLATGNTYGQGGSMRYVGTNKINGASLDRFTIFHMETDEDLTANILKDVDVDSALKVLPIWLQARRNVERYSLDVMVTPRCAFDTQAYIVQGLSVERAFAGRLHGRGLVPDQERKLLEGITF